MNRWKLVAVAILLGAMSVGAQSTFNGEWSWTEPTTGAPATSYVMRYTMDGGDWIYWPEELSEPRMTLPMEYGVTYTVQVAGHDSQNRQGVWSMTSLPYLDEGPPGPPGTPGCDNCSPPPEE